MAAPEGDGARPWANLPVEMVDTVIQHLDLFNATRLASVCTSWAAAVATNAALPLGAPYLLMTSEEEDDDDDHDHEEEWSYQLMDLTRGRGGVSFPALVRKMQDQWWVGGKNDWLAVVDQYGGARLLNPYSGHQIELPRTTAAVPATQSGRAFDRIVVCETPSDAGDNNGGGYLVIGVANHNFLAIARGGDVSWTALRNPLASRVVYEDAIVHKGKVFAVDGFGSIYSWDIRAGACPDPEKLRPPHVDFGELRFQRESWKLAESGDGRRLLLVCTYGEQVKRRRFSFYSGSSSYLEFVPKGVRLYERDVDGGSGGGWSPVASLGDHSLFLGANYPFFTRVVDQGSSDSDQQRRLVRPNCVCFVDGQLFRNRESDVEVFDLGAVEDAYNSCKLLWSNRRYNSCYQVPIWFRPRPILKNYSLPYKLRTGLNSSRSR